MFAGLIGEVVKVRQRRMMQLSCKQLTLMVVVVAVLLLLLLLLMMMMMMMMMIRNQFRLSLIVHVVHRC